MEISEHGPSDAGERAVGGGHCACCCFNLLKLLKPSGAVGQNVIPPPVGAEIAVKSEGEENEMLSVSGLEYLNHQFQFEDSTRYEDMRSAYLNLLASTDSGGIAYANGFVPFEENGVMNINLFEGLNGGGDTNPVFIDRPLTLSPWGATGQNDVAASATTNEFSAGLGVYDIQDPENSDSIISEVKHEVVVGESEPLADADTSQTPRSLSSAQPVDESVVNSDTSTVGCGSSNKTASPPFFLVVQELENEENNLGSEVKQEVVVGESEPGGDADISQTPRSLGSAQPVDESVVNSDTSTVGCGSSDKTASLPFFLVVQELENEENNLGSEAIHTASRRSPSSRVRYYCKSCNKGFSNQSSYKSHEIEHQLGDKLKPYSCKICNRYYTSRTSYKSHLHRHRQCKECGLQLENAPISHSESRKKVDLLCVGCKSKNKKIQGHNQVIQSILPKGNSLTNGKSSRSTRQGRSAFNAPQVPSEENVNEVATTSSAALYCNVCCITFVNPGRYDSHMENHWDCKSRRTARRTANPFVCPEPGCRAEFGTNHGLQNHRVKHMSRSSFACNKCDRKFKMEHHLKLHLFDCD